MKNTSPWQKLQKQLSIFARLTASQALPPALLLCGENPQELHNIAVGVAALFYCKYSNACGECPECLAIHHHPCIYKIDETPLIKVDTIKSGIAHLSIHGESASKPRVLIIVNADHMNLQSANKFLKTLEEPQGFSQIIMTTVHKKIILPTILSRVVVLDIPGLTLPQPSNTQKLLEEKLFFEMNSPQKNCISKSEILSEIDPEKSLSAYDVAIAFEKTLNRLYRTGKIRSDRKNQRALLRKIKTTSGTQHIKLNRELVLDALL